VSVSRRLSEILDEYTAILNDIERRHVPAARDTFGPVLQPADRQRGCAAPRIAHADASLERGWLR